MSKSHCTYTIVLKVAKSMRVVCETFARGIVKYYMKSNDVGGSNIFTHNHNCLMGTITFKVHHITPTSPRNMLATILKVFWFFLLFMFFAYFSFKHIMHGPIGERKEDTQLCKLNILILLCKCYILPSTAFMNYTQMFYDWRVLVVIWLFMPPS